MDQHRADENQFEYKAGKKEDADLCPPTPAPQHGREIIPTRPVDLQMQTWPLPGVQIAM